jgi:hypothetical protein
MYGALTTYRVLKRKNNAKRRNAIVSSMAEARTATEGSVMVEKTVTPASSTATAAGVEQVDRTKERLRPLKRPASL